MGRPPRLHGDVMARLLADADDSITALILRSARVLEQAPADPLAYQRELAGIVAELMIVNSGVRSAREIVDAHSRRKRNRKA